jgi:hypothetical protein
MSYKENQRKKAVALRDEMFQDPGGGIFRRHVYPFVLQNPKKNLWEKIRSDAITYFERYGLEWHDDGEPEKGPEGHLLSSNVACVNHLFFLRQNGDLATAVLKNIDSRIVSAELIEDEDGYVAFEINGKENPLNEKGTTRGAFSTSVDAVMVGKKNDGENILVLIEWKYTESYVSDNLHRQAHDEIYKPLLETKDCPIRTERITENNFEALYYEPFFQLMRQTLLGWKMVEAKEYGCDEYIHLHIIPKGNVELRRNITSPSLKPIGKDMSDVWKNLLKDPDKYRVISPDDFLSPLTNEKKAEEFLKYLKTRYWQ